MRRYRNQLCDCELWYSQIRLWDAVIDEVVNSPACVIMGPSPFGNREKSKRTWMDKHYKEVWWKKHKNQHPTGRARI